MAITPLPGYRVDPNNPNGVIRDLNFQQGQPASILSFGREQSQGVADSTTSASSAFGEALLKLLKRHQSLGTRPFAEQMFNAQQEQANRTSAQTPQSLIGASPGLQSGVRSASAEALNPTISGAQQGAQTFSEQINSVGSAIEQARLFGKEVEEAKLKEQERAAKIVELAIQQGSEGLDSLLRESPDIFKRAGYNTKEFEAVLKGLKAKETEDKRRFAVQNASKGTGVTDAGQDYTAVRQNRIRDSVNELKPRVNESTVGLGSLSSFLPGSPARNFKADLETLKANISFSELQEMRNASKTGGALGQVAIRELELLESTLGALDQGQSPESFTKNLQKILTSLDTWEQAKAQFGGAQTNQANTQTIRVKRLSDGVTGTIPVNEFDPSRYQRL